MLGLNIDIKLILIAAAVALVVALCVGAFMYHEGTVASLRRDLDKERQAKILAVERGEKLDILVRQSSAEVAAANRAAEEAKKQAVCIGQIQRAADRARTTNREVVHEAAKIQSEAQSLDALFDADRRARGLLFRRANDLFLRNGGPCVATPDNCPSAQAAS